MSKYRAGDRRFNYHSKIPAGGGFPGFIRQERAWSIIAAMLLVTGVADNATGTDLWLGPFYLLALGFSAWTLGRRAAVGVGAVAIALSVSANGLSLYPLGTFVGLWNLAMRIITILSFISFLGYIRQSYAREWRLARTDPLTGALNRQAFFELASDNLTSKQWTMFAYADLDGLKKLNDECGHAVGDEALKMYVAHVRSVIRANDHFARVGGDEFIVHFTVRDEASAKLVAERLHREMNLVATKVHPDLRCSVGVLILPPGDRRVDREVLTADQLMYEAKQQGAGLVVATLRGVRGSQFLLQHSVSGAGGSNPVVTNYFVQLEDQRLDAAA